MSIMPTEYATISSVPADGGGTCQTQVRRMKGGAMMARTVIANGSQRKIVEELPATDEQVALWRKLLRIDIWQPTSRD